ncbi:MAG: gluconate 2-dehydrogenase subunit 3 family protein [Rubrivivax sp.]
MSADEKNVRAAERRAFLKGAGTAAAALPAALATGPAAAQSAAAAPSAGYQCLSLEEAALTEALVDHMWPKDNLGASGTELGIATFIDRQLAGAFGNGDRLYAQGPFRKGKPQHGYQLPLTPQQYYKAGCAGMAAACQARFGKPFDKLAAADREAFLQDVAAGKAKGGSVDLGGWFNSLVYPLFNQGAFADPVYGGNQGKAAWKLIGYPGLPATYAQDVVRYRGKPHPKSANPQSIQDLS